MIRGVEESFEYQAEQAKVNFQASISSLLDFHSHYLQKISNAKTKNKPYVCSSIEESELSMEIFFKTISNLIEHYGILNSCNNFLHLREQMYRKILCNQELNLQNYLKEHE